MFNLCARCPRKEYTLAIGIGPADFDEAWIYCKQFNVALGVVKIE